MTILQVQSVVANIMNRTIKLICVSLLLFICTSNGSSQSWNTLTQCHPDFARTTAGLPVSLPVMLNDQTNNGAVLSIRSISYADHGTAVLSGQSIQFTPEAGFDGLAHVIYTACDQQSNCGIGQVSILVRDPSRTAYSDTITHAAVKGSSFKFYLPEPGFKLKNTVKYGFIAKIDDYQFEYHGLGNNGVKETLIFELGSKRKVFEVIQIELPIQNKFVKDDVVYLNKNTSKLFAPLLNDVVTSGTFTITGFTQPAKGEVTKNPNNSFTFSSAFDFEGISRFEYTACNNGGCETGYVYFYVSDFLPREDLNPVFRTAAGRPLVIPYDIPIKDYEFRVISGPQFGTLDYYSGNIDVNLQCETIGAFNPLLYTPFPGFVGTDQFVVNFCLQTGTKQCAPILIRIETYGDQNCRPASDFVWPGDANNDGLVDLKDLNTISELIGTTGPQRDQTGSEWKNLYSKDWNRTTSVNAKHADANGDGLVDIQDAETIVQNYNLTHKLVSQGVYFIDPAASSASPVAEVIAPGDDAVIQIAFGDADHLLYDVEAISFDLEYNHQLLDPSLISIEVLENSWFGYDNSILDSKVVGSGKISVSFASARGKGKSGGGKTVKIKAKGGPIVSHVEGFRIPKILPLEFKISNIQLNQANGSSSTLPPSNGTVLVDFDKKPRNKAAFEIFPNPASDWMNIKILDPNERIQNLSLISIDGRTVLEEKILPSNQVNQSIRNIQPGIYIIKAVTTAGIFHQKLEILK
ncbi:MAG: Ig-like domain-containing protein [Saprospiraceae bacterium]|nr:Ig-like domain-containing protein [Saprospiraceae bacterium]